jgi:response regulator RpfG family c-di-GMP phosphodiesterase
MEREYKLFLVLRESGENLKGSDARLPLTTKITLVASFTIIFLSAIFLFVILKDLKWLNSIPAEDLFEAKKSIFIQISAISLIFLLEVLNLIKSLTRNLKTFFTNQIEVLQAVAQGNLESRVTAATHDEFATMAEYTNHMIDKLRERTREVEITQDVTIHSLAAMAELRDPETGAHILRTQRYLRELALELKDTAGYKEVLTPENIELLYKSAPLHDIGKVGVRDAILLKPDRLTADEFEIMKKHTDYGQNILQKAEETLGTNSFLSFAKEIAISHQEKWDGSGYPEGLKGNEIPISGRLMAIADVYDALISRRVYKEPFTHEQTVEKIGEGRGTHFDPVMVDAFMRIEKKFNEIAKNFKET